MTTFSETVDLVKMHQATGLPAMRDVVEATLKNLKSVIADDPNHPNGQAMTIFIVETQRDLDYVNQAIKESYLSSAPDSLLSPPPEDYTLAAEEDAPSL